MNVFKLESDGTVSKIYQLDKIYLPKILSNPDEKVFVVGGSEDLKVTKTLNSLFCITMKEESSDYQLKQLTQLNNARASCGCCISQDKSKIYVAGGYISENQITKSVEYYDINKDKWTDLPSL